MLLYKGFFLNSFRNLWNRINFFIRKLMILPFLNIFLEYLQQRNIPAKWLSLSKTKQLKLCYFFTISNGSTRPGILWKSFLNVLRLEIFATNTACTVCNKSNSFKVLFYCKESDRQEYSQFSDFNFIVCCSNYSVTNVLCFKMHF